MFQLAVLAADGASGGDQRGGPSSTEADCGTTSGERVVASARISWVRGSPHVILTAMVSMETLVSLCKRRGFVFQSSEIYGGIGSSWDYGPLGVELKNKIKRLWWRDFVQRRPDMLGLDASILMHPTVWKASGHVARATSSPSRPGRRALTAAPCGPSVRTAARGS